MIQLDTALIAAGYPKVINPAAEGYWLSLKSWYCMETPQLRFVSRLTSCLNFAASQRAIECVRSGK